MQSASLESLSQWTQPDPRELNESGILIVDKPEGISSMDVIRVLRKVVKAKKIGHGGTLDPFATGVLPILINRATSLSNEVMTGSKEYEGEFVLGMQFDTQDITGQQIGQTQLPPEGLSLEQLQSLTTDFVGEILQTPPAFSAVKKNGKALYKYARAGQEVKVEPRKVQIDRFEILSWDGIRNVKFKVAVQKGVYVRTLIHDLGQKLGCGAVLKSLRRLSVGPYRIESAVQLNTLRLRSDVKAHLKPIEK